VLGLDLHAFLGSTGWADPEAVRFFLERSNPPSTGVWSLWMGLPDGLLLPAYVGVLLVLTFFTVGLGSPVVAVLTWAIVASTTRRSPVIVFGFDQIASTLALYLAATGASGKAVSLDRYLSRWRKARAELARRRLARQPLEGAVEDGRPTPSVAANLSLRLIQLHLCLMYGMAGLAKLQSPNWWDGSAFALLLGYAEFRPVDFTWLAAFPFLLMALTHLSIFLEVGYPALVWVRPLRPLLIALTIGLHLGIMLMMGLYEFAAGMIIANISFFSAAWLRGLVAGPAPLRVLFDGACPRCRASVALLGAGDPARNLEWLDLTRTAPATVHPSLRPEDCMRSMHAVTPGDEVLVGFDAVTAVARRAPLYLPFGMIGAIPGLSAIGRRIYDRVAATRPRDEPCTDESCSLPTRPPRSTPEPASRRTRR
jgi:predicted DCC family thiol-disulfide oxidoreductase YuxK